MIFVGKKAPSLRTRQRPSRRSRVAPVGSGGQGAGAGAGAGAGRAGRSADRQKGFVFVGRAGSEGLGRVGRALYTTTWKRQDCREERRGARAAGRWALCGTVSAEARGACGGRFQCAEVKPRGGELKLQQPEPLSRNRTSTGAALPRC